METEINKKTSGGKIALIIIGVIVLAVIVYYSVMMVLSPVRKLTEIKNEFAAIEEKAIAGNQQIKTDSAYLSLLKEKAFLQSRIVMAESDSIYLTISLADSTVRLEICGVMVHSAKMSDLSVSSIIAKGNENIILPLLSKPFTISSSIATIQKEPVMIKIAPKDTTEYKPDAMPDTSLTQTVCYILEMTNGTRIYVYQEEKDKPGDAKNLFAFDFNDRLRNTWLAVKNVAHFKVPEYHPYIKMKIPRDDAKIIYRAIPRHGQVGIYL
jgi:hypothetical protein